MHSMVIYKTKIPNRFYSYLTILLTVITLFLYYNVPLLTAYFYCMVAAILLYIFYIARNPLTCVILVFENKFVVKFPLRLKKNLTFLYKDIHSNIIPRIFEKKSLFFLKRHFVICSFLYGKQIQTLNLTLSPNIYDFLEVYSIIENKLLLFRKSIKEILKEGSPETGAYLIDHLKGSGLSDEDVIEIMENQKIPKEETEKHFNDLEELELMQMETIEKDYSSTGYLLAGVGLLLLFLSIGILFFRKIIVLTVFMIIIGVKFILKSRKIRNSH